METMKRAADRFSLKIAVIAAALFVVVISFGGSPAKAQLSSNARGLAGLIAVDNATNGGGLAGSNDLGDLIVLSGLFGNGTGFGTSFSNNASGLAGLIAVSNITDGGGLGGSNDLGDLIVLSGLFPTSTNAATNARDLAGLIAVSNATNGGGLSGDNSLGELIILNNLFLDP